VPIHEVLRPLAGRDRATPEGLVRHAALLACCCCLNTGAVGQPNGVGIGVGIFLIALGAILTFAVDWTVGGLNLQAVGWILMAVGVGGLILFFYFWSRRRPPQAVAVLRQHRIIDAPRTYDDPTPPPPPTVAAVPPVTLTTGTATAPVATSSQIRREG
jgi:Domain of unknown function (DUF6458)